MTTEDTASTDPLVPLLNGDSDLQARLNEALAALEATQAERDRFRDDAVTNLNELNVARRQLREANQQSRDAVHELEAFKKKVAEVVRRHAASQDWDNDETKELFKELDLPYRRTVKVVGTFSVVIETEKDDDDIEFDDIDGMLDADAVEITGVDDED